MVVGLDNFANGHRHNLADVQTRVSPVQWSRFTFIEGDITSPGDCERACAGVGRVLHQAAFGSVPRSLANPRRSKRETDIRSQSQRLGADPVGRSGRSYEDFCADEMLSSAIERKLEIIGEALVRIRRQRPEDLRVIGDWPAIIGFRNILAHAYEQIEDAVVWGIVSEQLPCFLEHLDVVPGLDSLSAV
jgi:uncharacterized protein with HEPN domain